MHTYASGEAAATNDIVRFKDGAGKWFSGRVLWLSRPEDGQCRVAYTEVRRLPQIAPAEQGQASAWFALYNDIGMMSKLVDNGGGEIVALIGRYVTLSTSALDLVARDA